MMQLSDDQWKEKLSKEQYQILRKKGTEAPFTGKLLNNDKNGDYTCAACGQVVFKSNTKFESNIPGLVGWPAFSAASSEGAVELIDDNSLGMHRTEIVCSNCGSHLGHLFENDPASPNGQHFCINSASLGFEEKN
jgi:peptide-methionine (R)-S-oxide reductase